MTVREHPCVYPFSVMEYRYPDSRRTDFTIVASGLIGPLMTRTAWSEPAGCGQETPPAELREAMLKRADELGKLWRSPLGARCYDDLEEATR